MDLSDDAFQRRRIIEKGDLALMDLSDDAF
jgi:hypothetical protein